MMEEKVLQHLYDLLEKRKTDAAQRLGAFSAKDMGEYGYACGVIKGLLDAQIEIQDLLRNFKEKDA